MRSYINYILSRFFAYIGMPQLVHWFCFDLSHTLDKEYWKTGNRSFLSSGKYINGKKHGEFRRYDENGDPIVVEKYNEGVLFSRLHVNMK